MNAGPADLAARLTALIRDVPDFPEPGVVFKDITPLLADHAAFAAAVDALVAGVDSGSLDKIVAIEARGFVLGAAAAYRCGAGLVLVRKQGKLPSATHAVAYDLEYGNAVLEVHTDAFLAGERVLLIDDVLATGGTALATAELVERAGATVLGLSVLVELSFLHGRAALAARRPGLPVAALVAY